MSSETQLSVIYFLCGNENKTEKCLLNQSLGADKIEIVKMPECSYKESLSEWQTVYNSLKGEYVTVVYEGDSFSPKYFEKLIAEAKKNDACVSAAKSVYAFGNEKNKGQEIKTTEVIDSHTGANFLVSMNGIVWKKDKIKVESVVDYGWETQSYYLLNMLLEVKKWVMVNSLTYSCAQARDDNFRFFLGLTDIDWYYKSIDEFLLPYLNKAKEKYGCVPEILQFYTVYFLRCRLNGNFDNRNKHLIEGDEVDEYLKIFHNILAYVDNSTILKCEAYPIVKIDLNIRRMLLQIKAWDFELEFGYLQNSSSVFLTFENYLIMSSKNLLLNIQLMDYKDGAFHIDFSMPSYFDKDKMRYFAAVGDNEYEFEFDERYSLSKYFGKAAYKRYGGKVVVPVKKGAQLQKITFFIEYNGVRQPLTLEFQSHTSRLSRTPVYSYWNVAGFTLYYCDQSIVVKKKKPVYTLYRELRCWLEMLLSFSKPIYALLLMRMAYWITRPFYKGKTIWMFYDKLYKGGDSSEYLYKYSLKQNDKIKKYYVLDKHSSDYRRMKKEGYIPVKRGTPKHYLTFFNASMMIVSNSTVFAFHNLSLVYSAYLRGIIDFHVCCVQHGLSVQKIAIAQRRLRDNTRLYFCASKYEIENLSRAPYNYEGTNALRLTGVPRYDGLVNDDKKQILIAPTWRMQSAMLVSRNEGVQRDYNPYFKETEYYKIYNGLINNERLIEAAKQYGYRIHYVLHPIVSPQAEDFDKNEYVDIIPSVGDMSYEKEFCESSLMVTDYSGIQFDFAYMRKPLVYLHHYKIPQHYEEGTYSYDTMAFGEICRDEDELIDLLIDYMKNNCVMKEMYKKRADDFYAFNDRNNCQRIYDDMIEYQHILDNSDNTCV